MTEIIYRDPTPEELAEREAYEAGAYDREVLQVQAQRQSAYQRIADPLFFKYQAGEATKEEWLAARKAVEEAHPYPEAKKKTKDK